jgi:hypothetical protein
MPFADEISVLSVILLLFAQRQGESHDIGGAFHGVVVERAAGKERAAGRPYDRRTLLSEPGGRR